MFQKAVLTFFVSRDGKPAAPITLALGLPETAAAYIRTSHIERIDIEWSVPDLSKPSNFEPMDSPKIILPHDQHFLQNKIDISGKSGVLKL
jgi:hypothetical protein